MQWRRSKDRCVEYLGGKCQECGYSGHRAALQFHHIEPGTKSFTIGSKVTIAWKKLVPELDKCILLCANCHAIQTCEEQKA